MGEVCDLAVYHARMGEVYDLAIRLKLEQEAKREHNKAMQSVLRQSSHPTEFIALGGDEQRMALDGSFNTASEFCNFYRDTYMVDASWFWENGNGIENVYMLDNARQEFAYLMNA